MITIYGLDGCRACKDAIALCDDHGQKYKYYLARADKVAEFTEDTHAPFILIDDVYIGSLDNLRTYIEDVLDRVKAIRTYLKEDVHIEFLKVDGTTRTIHCTQNMDRIPVEHRPDPLTANTVSRSNDAFLLKVYDLESGGWRSIRGERILRYS